METKIYINNKNRIGDVFNLNEILHYKDLFRELVLKDIKMRHKQTIFGVAWVIFQPIISAVIFTFIFGTIIKMPSDDLPYPLFVFIGLNFWNFFSSTIVTASSSLVGNEALIKKVYFPRIIIPLASIATNLFDFFISTTFLLVLSVYYNSFPGLLFILYLPILLFGLLIFLIGSSLFLASLNVRYRDVRQILPFFIQILIFLTPVFYPIAIVSPKNQWILALNPLTTIIEISRGLFTGNPTFNLLNICLSMTVCITTFLVGLIYFRKTEKYFADLI
jgi:lipopolysaccharide transport system permease protein